MGKIIKINRVVLLTISFVLAFYSTAAAQTTTEILNRAKAAIEKNEYVTAIADLNLVISREPNNSAAYAQRARAYVRQKLDDKALPDAEKALQLDPKNVDALNVRGIVKRSKKDLDGALADFKKVIALDQNYAKAYVNLAAVSDEKNAPFQEVSGYYNSYIKLLPNDEAGYSYAGDYCLRKGGASDVCAGYFTVYKKLKPESAAGYFGYAMAYANFQEKIADKNFLKGEVIQNFRRAIELSPKSPDVPLQLGRLQLLLSDFDGGIISLTQAVALNPKSDWAYAMRGDCYKYKGDYDKAIADYSKAIEINPTYQIAYNYRGLSYKNRNITLKTSYKTPAEKAEWEKVVTDYQKSAELSNQNFEAYETLDKFLDALESVNRDDERPAVFINSNGMLTQNWRDTSESISKNWRERTVKYFESLIAVNPKNTCAYLFWANNLEMKGAKAPYYQKAVDNFDGKNGARCSAEAAFNLGRDLEFAAREIESKSAFNDAKKIESVNTRIEAVKYFKLALQIDPNWTYPADWRDSTTAKIEEMEAFRKSWNSSPTINDSSSGTTSMQSNNSKPKAELDPYKVRKANEEYDRLHAGLEANMREYIRAYEKLRDADPNLRSLYSGTQTKMHQSRRNAFDSVEKFVKEYGEFVEQGKINHLYQDLSNFTELDNKSF